MQKSQRVIVQKETITTFSTYKYEHPQTNKVVELNAESVRAEIAKAKFYKNGPKISREIIPEKQEQPVIQVVNGDCLIEALELKKKGFRPLVLNMACATTVGGGYKGGAGAQEENLFRRTNLFQYHEPNKRDWYPIPEVGGIYCPNATVIRSSEQDQYEFLEVPETMSFVAVAAIRRPKLRKNHAGEFTLSPEAKELTQWKIQTILNIGLDNGHDAIVLSAFGCGAYRNPPSAIAQLFYEVISTGYAGGGENLPRTYRHISFAIIDDHNTNKGHNPEGNFLPFQNKFANGLEDRSINNVTDAMDSIQYISQESPEHQRRDSLNNNLSSSSHNFNMQKSQRIIVQNETITAFSTYKYEHPQTNKIIVLNAESIRAEIAKAKFYKNGPKISREIVPEKQEQPVIQVVNGDCLMEALELKKKGFRPLVLNMASAISVGGGYKSGAGAQEENLFRRTNLFQYHEPNKTYWYPIPEVGGIYCPNATVIRSSEQDQYEFLEVPETMSFVAVAAIRRPKLIKNHAGEFTLSPEAKELTRRKIQTILNIGLDNGHDAIVLSAFGCGAYHNPPSDIAQLFYEVISTRYASDGENLPRTYRHISFAIIDDYNTNKNHNPEGNFLPFQNKFVNGLEDGSINNVTDAMDSVLYISQESPEHPRRDSYNNNKGNYGYQRNKNQNRHPYNERRDRGRGKARGGFKGGFRGGFERAQTHSSVGRQMTLDAIWKYRPSQDHIDQLMRMGYSAKNAKQALCATEGNIEESLNWLNQNAVSDKMISLSLDKQNG